VEEWIAWVGVGHGGPHGEPTSLEPPHSGAVIGGGVRNPGNGRTLTMLNPSIEP
jgi:hypothetical protein